MGILRDCLGTAGYVPWQSSSDERKKNYLELLDILEKGKQNTILAGIRQMSLLQSEGKLEQSYDTKGP